MIAAIYEVRLYLNGNLIGDVRPLAQNLQWSRKRTKVGADSIDFTINDKLFNAWCEDRNTTINELLKPLALECRVVRNGVELLGGFLATMPAYQPLQTSANLNMHFDGYLNLLAGWYIRNMTTNLPLGTISGPAAELVSQMIQMANTVASDAGKAYGFTAGELDDLATITHTFDNYKTVKDWICDRCDNQSGAGPFDVYFYPDKTYDVIGDANFGDVITDWVVNYPTILNGTSATSINAQEVSGFASAIVGLGAGEVSSNADENTALFRYLNNTDAVTEYGYMEALYQESSISTGTVLENNMSAELFNAANPIWQPQITLHGIQVAPIPSGNAKIWIGDTIMINNTIDLTGMTNGEFRVNELNVAVTANGDETITPVLERV
ncbi:hypothetical protein IJ098_00495 [Candidatus Saccharibacteria bacterium]|nr:hypothetical protein [Candidatus Saccharibacteria bacterium]